MNHKSQNRDKVLKAIVRSCYEVIKNWGKYLGQSNSDAANSSQSVFSFTTSAHQQQYGLWKKKPCCTGNSESTPVACCTAL